MAITYTGGTGLFDKLGAIFGEIEDIFGYTTAMRSSVETTIQGKYADADTEFMAPLMESVTPYNHELKIQQPLRESIKRLIEAAQRTMIWIVHEDGNNLPAWTVYEGVYELITQMTTDAASVNASAVGSSTAAGGSNTGTGSLIVRTKDNESKTCEYLRAEDVTFVCVRDGQATTSILGAEVFEIKGEAAVDSSHPDWPQGSGMRGTITVASGTQEQGNQAGVNMLVNGDFEDFTANAPDKWTIETGVAGTDVTSTSTALRGSTALEFAGDGSTKSAISQTFGNATSFTGARLKPRTSYAVSCWVRDDGSAPAAGVLRVSLKNAAGTILDSTNAFVSVDLTAVGSTYAVKSFTMATGNDVSADNAVEIWIELTTALTNSRSVYIDEVVVQEMTRPQPGGPAFAMVAGGTNFNVKDIITATMTNTLGKMQQYADICFDMYGMGLVLPSNAAGGETIGDALVT